MVFATLADSRNVWASHGGAAVAAPLGGFFVFRLDSITPSLTHGPSRVVCTSEHPQQFSISRRSRHEHQGHDGHQGKANVSSLVSLVSFVLTEWPWTIENPLEMNSNAAPELIV